MIHLLHLNFRLPFPLLLIDNLLKCIFDQLFLDLQLVV